jgi:2-hydroxy-6-oxonona-2,4-dienedioate hydrolase
MSPSSTSGDAPYRAIESRLWASLGVTPREHRVRLAALGVEVRVQETGSGPPVLFLHGGSTCGTSWADLAAAMPAFRCLLLDRPGTGLSEALREDIRSIDDLGDLARALVPDVLDALGLGVVDVVATSFGGYFAFHAALAQPLRIRRIIEMGWSAGAPVPRLPLMMRLGTAPLAGDLLARMPASDATVRGIFRGIGLGPALDAGRIADEAIAAYRALLTHTPTLRNDLGLGRLFLSPVRGMDPRILLGEGDRRRIASPVLLAWGEADPFGGPAVARAFAAPFPDARLELLPGVGHAPWMGDAADIATLVSEFLTEPHAARQPRASRGTANV